MARKLTYEEFKHFIEVESGSGCKLLSKEYSGSKNKILLKCKCGDNFETTFNRFNSLNKRLCDTCSGKIQWNYNMIKRFIEIESNSNCILLSKEYKNSKTKLLIQCGCGNKFYIRFNEFYSRNQRKCQECAREMSRIKQLKTNEGFIKEVYDLVGDEYTILDEYNGALTKINIIHNKCGNVWHTSPANLLNRGSRCPSCYHSKGEEKILKYLQNNRIEYKKEYPFDNCKNINPLPFDFYLPDYNMLIEYDGEHHYRPVNFGGISDEDARLRYESTKENDSIKNQYCKDNNMLLLRIPYWEFDNIEQILEEWLEKHYLLHKNKKIA